MQSANQIVLITPMPIAIGSSPLQMNLQWGCSDNPLVRRLYASNLADWILPTLYHNKCKEGGSLDAICKWPHRPIIGHDIHADCTWPNFATWRVSDTHFVCRLLSPHPTVHNNISKQVGCMQPANHRIVRSNQTERNQIILITHADCCNYLNFPVVTMWFVELNPGRSSLLTQFGILISVNQV